ncbi:acyl-CoA dehydrogenase family protein [Rhodococcus sp. NPDC056960]|uniref:acyl-CoA dehydrogenase family protein n=1 Tax=Rhodococcus sp. NPDC056960 TaxID=3345982 RepID=UPI003637CE31
MSWSKGWWGPVLGGDGNDVRAMLDSFVAAHELVLEDDTAVVAGLVAELAELGIWTVGTAESAGGGGAGRELTVVALERLGRAWPALGWASVQAHAAVCILTGDDRFTDLVAQVHTGTAAVAVVDASSPHVRLAWSGDTLTGSVDRVDTAAENPHVLVLVEDGAAVLIAPTAMIPTPLRRTGLGGAFTRSLDVQAAGGDVHELFGVDVAGARTRLRLGAAAVAAGIAGAAADDAAGYASGRRQFGAALTEIPTVRQSLLGQATRSVITLGSVLAAADDDVQTLAVVREACDGAIDVAAAALQAHGGYGYLAEYGAERRLRDAVSLRAAVDTQGAAVATARTLVHLAPVPTALRKKAA